MAFQSACLPSDYSPPEHDEAYDCQQAGEKPYCWPRNGMRICEGGDQNLSFYWSPPFYHENAWFFVDFGNQTYETIQGGPREHRAHATNSTGLTAYEKYAERASNGTFAGERILRLTIREYWPDLDYYKSTVHAGPTLILESPRATMTSPSSSSAIPKSYSSNNDEGKLIGIILGSCIGGIVILVLLFLYCGRCCGACCGCAGRSEEKRIRRLEARRLERDGESQIDATMKVAHKEVEVVTAQKDPVPRSPACPECPACPAPVRRGGMWATDMPRRAPRPASTASDEIRASCVVEEQRAEERRVEERRQEVARAEEIQPPVYEEAPPKYAP